MEVCNALLDACKSSNQFEPRITEDFQALSEALRSLSMVRGLGSINIGLWHSALSFRTPTPVTLQDNPDKAKTNSVVAKFISLQKKKAFKGSSSSRKAGGSADAEDGNGSAAASNAASGVSAPVSVTLATPTSEDEDVRDEGDEGDGRDGQEMAEDEEEWETEDEGEVL